MNEEWKTRTILTGKVVLDCELHVRYYMVRRLGVNRIVGYVALVAWQSRVEKTRRITVSSNTAGGDWFQATLSVRKCS